MNVDFGTVLKITVKGVTMTNIKLDIYKQDFNCWINNKPKTTVRKNTLDIMNEFSIARFKKSFGNCNKFQQNYLVKQYVKGGM